MKKNQTIAERFGTGKFNVSEETMKVTKAEKERTATGGLYDYSGLDEYFAEFIGLRQSMESVMEASAVLALIPHTSGLEEKAAFCHTIGNCLYEYGELLKRIKVSANKA